MDTKYKLGEKVACAICCGGRHTPVKAGDWIHQQSGESLSGRDTIAYAGFFSQTDALLFYLRFR